MNRCKRCNRYAAPGREFCGHNCECNEMAEELEKERTSERNEVIDSYISRKQAKPIRWEPRDE